MDEIYANFWMDLKQNFGGKVQKMFKSTFHFSLMNETFHSAQISQLPAVNQLIRRHLRLWLFSQSDIDLNQLHLFLSLRGLVLKTYFELIN